ncbi:MAG TPA: sigma-70 family RNA polymerase sigma factor [Planctomycetota bacterium]
MQAPSPEQNFARYRDHGDLPALAAVFDAYAGQLLLVAGHLVHDGALAEDLVQTTFVEAMRSASRYDAERALLPWLVQILTHHAKKLRRQRGRPADPRPRQREAHASAAEPVLDQEVITAVERALDQLPMRYRQVLTLRLVHELSPTAIAHALGCPPETVKTRLKRGLEHLRRHLPSSIATSIALLLATGRGLAAVRTDVLLHAQHAALRVAKTTVWGVLPFGVLWMNQFLFRAGVVALVLVLGWTTVELMRADPVQPAAAAEGAVPVVAAIDAAPSSGAAAMRSEVAPAPPADAAVVFVGRCLDATTGRPMSGVSAGAWWIQPGIAKVANEYEPTAAVARVLTNDEGRFRLRCALTEASKLQVRVGREDLLLRLSAFGPFPAPQEVDLGDLQMHAGVRLATRVVDQRGQPVGGVVVAMTLEGTARQWRTDPLMERSDYSVRSALDGSITWPGALLPGRYEVHWYEDSIPPERSRSEISIPDRASYENELVYPIEDEHHAITGVVVDDNGRPVAGHYLSGEGAGTRGHCRTSRDGRFVMPRIGPYDERLLGPVTITTRSGGQGYELVNPMPCQWGQKDVRLVVRTGQHLVVRAIDPRTGKPVQEPTVLCALVSPGNAPFVVKPRKTTLADGAVQLGIARAPHLVQVLPKDEGLAPSALVRWEPGSGDEVRIELLPTRAVDVHVVTARDEPVRGSEVWTALLIEGSEARGSALEDAPMPLAYAFGLDAQTRWERYGVDDAPLDHGTTDALGRVRLRVPMHGAVLIAAFGPGHVPRAVVAPADGERIDVRVQRGAAVRFELSPAELVRRFSPSDLDRQLVASRGAYGPAQRLTFAARRVREEQDPRRLQPTVTSAVTGSSCTCAGLVPGTYEISVYGRVPSELGDVHLHDQVTVLALQEGEERIVPVDLRRWAPGRVRGQVLVNGAPWAFRAGSLEALSSSGIGTYVEVSTDAEGRFEADMVPGQARFHLRSLFDHGTWWCAAERCSVVAGSTTEIVFDVRRVAARVRVTTFSGQPAAGLGVVLQRVDEAGDTRSWITDEQGCFTIDPAPLTPFELRVPSPEPSQGEVAPAGKRDVLLGPVQVPQSGSATELDVHLPRGWR